MLVLLFAHLFVVQEKEPSPIEWNPASPGGRFPLTAQSLAKTPVWGPMRGSYRAELHPGPSGFHAKLFHLSLSSRWLASISCQVLRSLSKFSSSPVRHVGNPFVGQPVHLTSLPFNLASPAKCPHFLIDCCLSGVFTLSDNTIVGIA